MIWLVLALLRPLDTGCEDLAATRWLLERAHAFEINHLEDAHGSALLEGLAQCQTSAARAACEAGRHQEFRRAVERSRATLEEKYRRLVEEHEARCRAPLA